MKTEKKNWKLIFSEKHFIGEEEENMRAKVKWVERY
jgi:hypothetical protein